MTAPDTSPNNTAPASKTVVWVAAAVLAVAVVLNLIIMSRGGRIAAHAWALLIGLAISLPAYFTSNRGTQRLFIGVAMIVVLAGIYGLLTKSF